VIRVRHLLTHTSEGIPGSNYQYSGNRFGRMAAGYEVSGSEGFTSATSNAGEALVLGNQPFPVGG
jgi:hypothetical protein